VRTYAQELERGWNELRSNSPVRAADTFGALASSNLDEGLPKIGFSLASAMVEEDRTAAWAMRRAFRIDPDRIMYAPIDDKLTERIDSLLYRYNMLATQRDNDNDALFMVASLSFLVGQTDDARAAAEELYDRGDRSIEVNNLLNLLPEPIVIEPVEAPQRGRDMYGPSIDND
jgi:hypothetical protein